MELEIISKHPREKTHSTLYFLCTAHDMMLEPGWGAVADRILGWLNTHNL